jgi:hypothetical protein
MVSMLCVPKNNRHLNQASDYFVYILYSTLRRNTAQTPFFMVAATPENVSATLKMKRYLKQIWCAGASLAGGLPTVSTLFTGAPPISHENGRSKRC